ncbi:MAG: hypothetical protein JW967_02390 [Dehalococcoidales bacterium]|nr:hypothetical protein [Dehalococcoidales bacterium]
MALKGFDPGNMKWYDNIKEHVTKQVPKGNMEDITKKKVQGLSDKPPQSKKSRKI